MSEAISTEGTGGTAQGDTNAGAGDGGQAAASFIETLPEDLRGNEVLKGYDSAEKLARAHIEALGKVPAPPENAEGYDITIPEGHPVNQELVNQFKAWAHEAGLSQEQAAKLSTGYIAMEAEISRQIETEIKAAEEAVRKEWGGDYEKNLATALKAVEQFCSPEDRKWLDDSGMTSNPVMVRLMYKIGQAMNEDVIGGGGGARGASDMPRTAGGIPQLDFPSMQKK